jgi:uncharacterized protein (TIGR02646 family)
VIPIKFQPEPNTFDQLVRKKGKLFLRNCSNSRPTTDQWENKDYWKYIRKDLYEAYDGICAYSAHWIPFTDNPNIDHYIPKSVKPDLAYEWSNYRLACSFANTLKKDYPDVLDPFQICNNMFFLDFPSLLVTANPTLPEKEKKSVEGTIDRLKLNDDRYINVRSRWLELYCKEGLTIAGLKKNAPFIAYELERQNLIDEIKSIMIYGLESED